MIMATIDPPDRDPVPCLALEHGDHAFIDFVRGCQAARGVDPRLTRETVVALTQAFVAQWRMPDPRYLETAPNAAYASYLLYRSPAADLSIVLDSFMPGQAAVIHNHRCWGVFVCLEAAELERRYRVDPDLRTAPVEILTQRNPVGQVCRADPERHAFHQVECALDATSVSLHIYGADIGTLVRDRWNVSEGFYEPFHSGYSNLQQGLPVYLDEHALLD